MIYLNFEIKPFNFKDNRLVNLAINLLNEDSSQQSHSAEFWKWRFEDNPFGEPLGWYAIDIESDRIACLLLFWPWKFNTKSTHQELLYQAINGKTNALYRNKGLFYLLNKQAIDFFNEKKNNIYGFPNKQSMPSYKKLNWEVSSPLVLVLAPIFSMPSWLKIKRPLKESKSNNAHGINFDIFSESVSFLFYTKWSREIFNWRFMSHPQKDYSFYNENDNLIVYRIIGRGIFREAKIIMSQINSAFNIKNFKKHLKKEHINFFTYVGLNTQLSDEINKLFFKVRMKKKLYFVNSLQRNQKNNSFRVELAESDSQ